VKLEVPNTVECFSGQKMPTKKMTSLPKNYIVMHFSPTGIQQPPTVVSHEKEEKETENLLTYTPCATPCN